MGCGLQLQDLLHIFAITVNFPSIVSAELLLPRRVTNGSTPIFATTAFGNATCGSDACATACAQSWVSWSSRSSAYVTENAHFTLTPSIVTYNATTTILPVANSSGTVYATCDGYPRFSGIVDYKGTKVASVPALTTTFYATSTSLASNFSVPTPTCVINTTQCVDLRSDWQLNNYLAFPFNDSSGFFGEWYPDIPETYPHCSEEPEAPVTYDEVGCFIKGAAAAVYYWPDPIEVASNSTNLNLTCPTGPYTSPSVPASTNATIVTKVMELTDTFYGVSTTVTMTSPTIYLSMEDVEGRGWQGQFSGGGPIPLTVFPVNPTDLYSVEIAPPLITNEALSSSAASVIANKELDKLTDLLGVDWQARQHPGRKTGPPNLPITSRLVNIADFGRPPQVLSYYFGAAGWFCLNQADPYASHDGPISQGLPPGMECNTIYDQAYKPWLQIPATLKAPVGSSVDLAHPFAPQCQLLFGWDPPIALQQAETIALPSVPTPKPIAITSQSQPATPKPTPSSPIVEPSSTPTALPDQNPSLSSHGNDPSSHQGQTSVSPSQNQPDPASQSQVPAHPSQPNNPKHSQASPQPDQPNDPTPSSNNPSEPHSTPKPQPQPTPITVGGVTASPDPSNTGVIIGGQTITPGQTITIGGSGASATPVAMHTLPNGETVVSVGSTAGTFTPGPSLGARVFTFGGTSITAPSKGKPITVAGQTLSAGSTAVIDGTTLSLGTDGSTLVVGGSTQVAKFATPQTTVSIDGTVYTANPSGTFTVDGTAFSLGTDGSTLIAVAAPEPTFSIDGIVYTESSGSLVVHGQTLTPGGEITISGTTWSLAPNGQSIVVGSSTYAYNDARTTDVGGYIATGISASSSSSDGNVPAKTSPSSEAGPTQTKTGGAHQFQLSRSQAWWISLAGMAGLYFVWL